MRLGSPFVVPAGRIAIVVCLVSVLLLWSFKAVEGPAVILAGTSLERHETKSHLPAQLFDRRLDPDLTARDVSFRHSGWTRNRDRIMHAFRSLRLPEKRLERFENCGANAWVMRATDEPELFRLSCDRCRDRFCVPCGREKAQVVAGNLDAALGGRTVRFVTLTLRSREADLAECVDRLYRCFARLRRRKCWSCSQAGGAAFLEIKWTPEKQQWHPHLHIVCEGKFLDQRELSNNWKEITGDSFIVDIRLIKQSGDCARYVTKYVAKGLGGSYMHDPDKVQEAILCLSGRRLFATFGSWRGMELLKKSCEHDWECVARLRDVQHKAELGDPESLKILEILSPKHKEKGAVEPCEIPGPSP